VIRERLVFMKMDKTTQEREKLEIIKWVTGLKDKTTIERLKLLRENPGKSDWWNEISGEEKNAIDKGLENIKAGRVKAHKEAKSFMASGYKLLWTDKASKDMKNIISFFKRKME